MEQEFHFFEEQDVLEKDSREESLESDSEESIGPNGERTLKVRLDKWLWAARFFKTRALARAAVEAGRVFYNGERSKPTREIELGAILQVRLGRIEKTVIVKGLSTRRRSTEEALSLFEETEESRQMREQYSFDYQDNRNPRFQFNANPSLDNSREKRPGRFLRRSFNRPDSESFPNSSGPDDLNEDDASGNFDREEQQPLTNDSSFPYPQRRDSMNYRNDHSNYRNHGHDNRSSYPQDHHGNYRAHSNRGKPNHPGSHRNFDHSGQRYQENSYPRNSDQGYRNQDGYRSQDGYRNQDNYGNRHSDGHSHPYRNQEGHGHRNQESYGYRNQENPGYRNQEGYGYRNSDSHYRNQDSFNHNHTHHQSNHPSNYRQQDHYDPRNQRGKKQEEFESND